MAEVDWRHADRFWKSLLFRENRFCIERAVGFAGKGEVMESRWWLSVMGGVLSFVALGIPSHAMAGGEDGVSTGTQQEDETPEWAKKLYGEPPEFKVFEVAGHKFRVPTEYLTASSDQERGVFQIAPHWPTLDSPRTEKPQPRDREDFDTLQVTVRPLERYALRQSNIWGHIAEVELALERGHKEVEERAGLVRIKDTDFWVTWRPELLGDSEQVVLVLCDPDAPADRVGRCRVSYLPFQGVGVQIKFDRPLFDDWQSVVDGIYGMLSEFKETK